MSTRHKVARTAEKKKRKGDQAAVHMCTYMQIYTDIQSYIFIVSNAGILGCGIMYGQ